MKETKVQHAFAKFKPENCVFVISVGKKDEVSGMVAGWNMKCSMRPPMFAVALAKKSHTHKLISWSKEFVVAVPNKQLEKEVNFFGSTHGNLVDKFKQTAIATIKAKYVKSPLVKDATINLECRLVRKINCGDHIIFVGKVLTAYINRGKKVLLNMKKVGAVRIFEEF